MEELPYEYITDLCQSIGKLAAYKISHRHWAEGERLWSLWSLLRLSNFIKYHVIRQAVFIIIIILFCIL